MVDTSKLAQDVVRGVGSERNIRTLEHCTTRLRFTLEDGKRADRDALESVPGVISVVDRGGQLQVVVGNDVASVYQAIVASTNLDGRLPNNKREADERSVGRRVLDTVFDFISGTFSPLLWALVGASMIKTIIALLTNAGWLAAESGTFGVLTAAGEAVFYFLPILVGVTASLKLGANPYVGGSIGAALMAPGFLALGATGTVSEFIGVPMVLMDYSSQVFPVMVSAIALAGVERVLKRVLHKNLHLILIPTISLLVIVPLAALVFGPFGVYLGEGMATVVSYMNDTSSILTGVIVAGSMFFLVTLGLHWALIPIILANLAATGTDPLLAGWAGYNFALMGLAFGVFHKSRDTNLKSVALSGGISGLLAGVSEPTVYGVVLRNRRTIPILLVAAALGGGINGLFGVTANAFLFQSIFTIPGFQPVGGYLVGIGVAFVVGLVGVLVFGYEKTPQLATGRTADAENTEGGVTGERLREPGAQRAASTEIFSPLNGELVPLGNVPDPIFAGGVLGRGLAVRPTEGKLFAPVNGTVVTVASTGHAVGILSDDGLEILMHVGIDTVNMGGANFTPAVATGQNVEVGDLLLDFDLAAIAAAGFDTVTPIVVTGRTGWSLPVAHAESGVISAGAPLLELKRENLNQNVAIN